MGDLIELVFERGHDRWGRTNVAIQHRHEGLSDGLGGTLRTFIGRYDPINDYLELPTSLKTMEVAEIVLKCREMREQWK